MLIHRLLRNAVWKAKSGHHLPRSYATVTASYSPPEAPITCSQSSSDDQTIAHIRARSGARSDPGLACAVRRRQNQVSFRLRVWDETMVHTGGRNIGAHPGCRDGWLDPHVPCPRFRALPMRSLDWICRLCADVEPGNHRTHDCIKVICFPVYLVCGYGCRHECTDTRNVYMSCRHICKMSRRNVEIFLCNVIVPNDEVNEVNTDIICTGTSTTFKSNYVIITYHFT